MSTKFRDEAIPLITFTENKFQINPEAIEILKEVEAPMSVVGVAGVYRSGKSYLLNKIVLNQTKGFEIGSTINACTKGIWIWGRPIKAQTEDNTIVNMIVMDSEGLGSLEADASHDSRIFALILLLSSTFVYNSNGAIDENAINQLSVVINITKHISIKSAKPTKLMEQTSLVDVERLISNGSQEIQSQSEDLQEYSRYFPEFFWVLRDFALQMVDEYGDEMTSSEYLESALQSNDNGNQYSLEKNKIRELIKTFFRTRKCFPLVRPVIDESDLGRLNTLKLESLRAEFVEGALHLKNSLVQSAKIKRINERVINGEILASMLSSYITTMNEGVVPNIEATWFYVTQKQAGELVSATMSKYQSMLNSQIKSLIPSSKANLKEFLETARTDALQFFKTSSFLSEKEQEEYKKQITAKIQEQEKSIMFENETEFEKLLKTAMTSHYKEDIYTPLLNETIKDHKELISLFKSFKNNFDTIEPNGPHKKRRILKFLFSKICESFTIYSKNFETKFNNIFEDKVRECESKACQLQDEIKELTRLKQEQIQKVQEFQTRFASADFENSKLSETVRFLQEEKNRLEIEYEQSKNEEKTLFKKKNEDLAQKLEDSKKQLKFLESNLNKQKSEFEIELSLLTQQIEFYVKIEKELTEQKSKLVSKQKELEDGFEAKVKKMSEDFEEKLQAKSCEMTSFKDKKNNLENELSELRIINSSFQKESSEKEGELNQIIMEYADKIKILNDKLVNFETRANQFTDDQNAMSDKLSEFKIENLNQEKKLKEKDDKIKALGIDFESKLEILQQENEFLKSRIIDLENEVIEAKRIRELSTQTIQKTNSILKTDISQQLQDTKASYEQKIIRMQSEHDQKKDELHQQMISQCEEYEAKITSLKEEKEKSYSAKLEAQKLQEASESKSRSLEEKLHDFEKNKFEKLKKDFESLEKKFKMAESQNENILIEKEEEIIAAKQMFETNLANMKVVYENEKTILEKKLAEEKSQRESLIQESLEEMLARKDSELQQLEDELECLRNELISQDAKTKTMLNRMTVENSELKSKTETSERKFLEAFNSSQKNHSEETAKLRNQLSSIESEKRLTDERLMTLKNEINVKNMEVFKLEQSITSNQALLSKLMIEKEKSADELATEIAELKSKIDKSDVDKFQISEELINSRIHHTKDIALKNQKIEFIENKIHELNCLNEIVQNDCEEKIKTVSEKLKTEIEELKIKNRLELESLNSKYDNKKKQLKESEFFVNNKLAELEKHKVVLQERNAFLETKKLEMEENSKQEITKIEKETKRLVEILSIEKNAALKEAENMKNEKYEVDVKLTEILAKGDKDKAIFEAKINFMEQQNRKLKSDLVENQNSIDSVFQNFQQFRANDKEETETSHNNYVISMEERYSSQIQDLKDQNRNNSDSFKQKIKSLEKEIKRLEEANEELMTQKFELSMQHEKKLNELAMSEKSAINEIERLKENMAKLDCEGQKESNSKIESLQKRSNDLEAKIKGSENEKNMLIFKQEKMKTNWNIEKDTLMSNKTDLLDKMDRIKKQNEYLGRENDKLKTDLKMLKKNNIMGSIMNLNKGTSQVFGIKDAPFKDVTDWSNNGENMSKF